MIHLNDDPDNKPDVYRVALTNGESVFLAGVSTINDVILMVTNETGEQEDTAYVFRCAWDAAWACHTEGRLMQIERTAIAYVEVVYSPNRSSS